MFIFSLTINSSSENNSVTDIHSEREDSPDFIANLIHDTTKKLQNLTIELNNHDDESYKYLQKPNLYENTENYLKYATLHSTENSEEQNSTLMTMQKFLKQEQNSSTHTEQVEESKTYAPPFSSPHKINQIGCEINSTSALTSVACAKSSASSSLPSSTAVASDETQNNFNGILNSLNDIKITNDDKTILLKSGVTIQTTNNMSLELMQSVDLSDSGKLTQILLNNKKKTEFLNHRLNWEAVFFIYFLNQLSGDTPLNEVHHID